MNFELTCRSRGGGRLVGVLLARIERRLSFLDRAMTHALNSSGSRVETRHRGHYGDEPKQQGPSDLVAHDEWMLGVGGNG